MKYTDLFESKFLTDEDEIINYMANIFSKFEQDKLTIESDGLVYDGHLKLRMHIKELEVQFKEVTGDFSCNGIHVTSLKGFPKIVGSYFDCTKTNITTLKYCPQSVKYNFVCSKTIINDPREYRYALYCDIGSQFYFYSDIKEIDEIINTYGGSNNRKYWSHAINLLSKVKL